MHQTAIEVIRYLIAAFCVTTMFAVGLDLSLRDLYAPLRNLRVLAIIILASNVIVPLVAVMLIILPYLFGGPLDALIDAILPYSAHQKAGLILAALAAGTLLGPTMARIAKGKIPLAQGATAMFVVASVALIPIQIRLLDLFSLPGLAAFQGADITDLYMTLLLFQLLPLGVGVAIKTWYGTVAVLLRPFIVQLTGLLFLFVLVIYPATGQSSWKMPDSLPSGAQYLGALTVPSMKNSGTSNGSTQPNEEEIQSAWRESGFGSASAADPAIESIVPMERWRIIDDEQMYIVDLDGRQALEGGYQFSVYLIESYLFPVAITPETIDQLDQSELPTSLKKPLSDNAKVIVKEGEQKWLIKDGDKSYIIEKNASGETAYVYTGASGLAPLASQFLAMLEKQPVLKEVIDFFEQMIVFVIPLAVFAAIALIYLLIGYYGGVFAQGTVGVAGVAIPRTLATSTAVRNISAALILAVRHFSGTPAATNDSPVGPNLEIITTILIFYLISLAVAFYRSVKWGRQETAEADDEADTSDVTGELEEEIGALSAG